MSPELLQLIAWSTLDTLVMVGLSALFGTLFGLPLGIFLATSRANELFPAPAANRIVGLVVNATRSTPFIILVVAIVPQIAGARSRTSHISRRSKHWFSDRVKRFFLTATRTKRAERQTSSTSQVKRIAACPARRASGGALTPGLKSPTYADDDTPDGNIHRRPEILPQ